MREIQYYVNPKTRLCQGHNGPTEYLKRRAAEAERHGFIPATEAEVDAFRKVTEHALQQGWKPERMHYDTWLKVRTYNPEPAEVRKAKAATALQAERERENLAELEEFYAELRKAKSRLTRRALTHINALVNELNDAQQLLAKYRQHVEDCESIDFLDQIGDARSDVTFTPAEQAALLALRNTPETDHD
jgi:DNA anti-recombination protein RmuC